MIDIRNHTLLAAYGPRCVNMSVLEQPALETAAGVRVFHVFETNWGANSTQYVIELAANQEAAKVSCVQSGESQVLYCANNRTADELFEHSILPAAEKFLK